MTADASNRTLCVLQISDPHFGTEVAPVKAALEQLAARLQPQLLILSGDITQRARRAQFAAARAFVDRLGIPHELVIAGNHDIPLFNLPARLLWPYAGWQRVFGRELEPVIELPRLLAIGVRTTRRWRHKHGQVSAAQIARVAARLRAGRPEQLKLVVTHQPLDVITASDRNNLLRGHVVARAAWIEAGADLFLAGHIHLPHLRPLSSPELPASQPRPGHLPMAVQAGTALSHRLRGAMPNSVNVIELYAADPAAAGGTRIDGWVRRFDFHAPSGAFAPAAELAFHR